MVNPISHFGAPGSHFEFCRGFYAPHRRSTQIKKHILLKFFGAANNLQVNPFTDTLAIAIDG